MNGKNNISLKSYLSQAEINRIKLKTYTKVSPLPVGPSEVPLEPKALPSLTVELKETGLYALTHFAGFIWHRFYLISLRLDPKTITYVFLRTS